MAFGIDDVLTTAAAGISLTDTVVKTIKDHRKKGLDLDIERLIEQVRITALERIDDADRALSHFERLLGEKGVDPKKTLQDAISSTHWWRPDESHRLKQIRRSFNALADATYDACDDIAALLRCRQQTDGMGAAIVDSAKAKHELHSRLLNAKSVKDSIDILRAELKRHNDALKK